MKPTVNRFSTPSVKMSESESKIIIMTESNGGSQAFWIIITGETNESLGSVYEIMAFISNGVYQHRNETTNSS